MIIKLSPMRSNRKLCLERDGESLIINGEIFDFSPLNEGDTLPHEAVQSEFICGDVTRKNGNLVIPVMLTHGYKPSDSIAFPEDIVNPNDGLVELPK